ncbi:hypothetical protein [Caldimonas tepidiphila]|uniref:SCO family protein n=1 Tax=Caldimonas tepidiphila TaxID=2315841 RepID=UPI003013182A
MPQPSLEDARRIRHGRLKLLLVLLVCAAPVIASYFTYYVLRPQGRTNYGELILPTRELPPGLLLRDLQGGRVPTAALRQQWQLVVVAGGDCDRLCETQLYLQRQLRETLGKDRARLDKLWLVPDDAAVRPEVLRSIGDARVLRVPRAELAAWLEPAAGQALENHFYLVDPMGQWMMRFPAQPDPSRIKRDLTRLMTASRSWDTAGH